MSNRLAVAGSGAIACGLAATAAHHGPVLLLARSEDSAERARATVEKTLTRLGAEVDPEHVEIVTDPSALAEASFVVEAVVEEVEGGVAIDGADLLETADQTADEGVDDAGDGVPAVEPEADPAVEFRNQLRRMPGDWFPTAASEETRTRALALCETFEKVPVEVPDIPGFVVNRLLFPYLFSAVRLVEETGMDPADVDTCMRLGAGHPMGPLALLDLVGLDVSKAIGETIGERIPPRIEELVAGGALGRKSGRGLHTY